uniref:Palmitoyltransferase n=1 Tax=Toxoplasma gondii COUG TaxID=1074873 RepID=A0A2G8Y8E2_TOXGO|nr:DHHC zinc finger domain-containing protein [Toxoplasma gondii COUG]
MFLLGACVFLLLLVCLALLWFFSTPDGSSPFSTLHRLVFLALPARFLHLLERVCGTRVRRGVEGACFYVFHTNNPIVQIVYLAVMIGGYSQVVLVGYPWIPNAYLGAHHKFIAFGAFVACLATFLVCSLKNPGIINHTNVDDHVRLYPYDACIYFSDTECSTCRFPKPARSKHCRLCNVCVARFDHHCVWIGNCVGARNHGVFIIFLITHFLTCAYGSVASLSLLLGIIDAQKLLSATYIDPSTGRRSAATWSIIFQYMAGRFGSLIFLAVLFIVFFFLLLGFTAFHLYTAVWRNSTTNESFKYRCMRQVLSSPFSLDDEERNSISSESEGKRGSRAAGCASRKGEKTGEREGETEDEQGRRNAAERGEEEGEQESAEEKELEGEENAKKEMHPALMTPARAAQHVEKARAKYRRNFLDSVFEVFAFDEWMRETLRLQDEKFANAVAAATRVTQEVVAAVGEKEEKEKKDE